MEQKKLQLHKNVQYRLDERIKKSHSCRRIIIIQYLNINIDIFVLQTNCILVHIIKTGNEKENQNFADIVRINELIKSGTVLF